MKKALLLVLLYNAVHTYAQNADAAIRNVLEQQRLAWNNGDIEDYMKKGYWQSDSLVFVGKSGATYGYTATLERYKKSYSDAAKMGTLLFDIIQVRRLDDTHYFVLGKWHLKRTAGDLDGSFTLLFKKINRRWVIIADHSS
ncbi:MAG: nuclear transport factor 2 family protein [Bacteroidetes bacterium]|nr:nuclear transport factor 2 family protein [Bacteroidota bacterium]